MPSYKNPASKAEPETMLRPLFVPLSIYCLCKSEPTPSYFGVCAVSKTLFYENLITLLCTNSPQVVYMLN